MSIADKLTTIAENVPRVYEAGKTDGKQEGFTDGYEAGKKAEYDAFWDTYTKSGSRTDYRYAFAGDGWIDDLFNPPFVIYPTLARYMFYSTEITEITEKQVDFSQTSDMRDAFSTCDKLATLVLKISGSKTFNANTFVDCKALTNLSIIGTIESNNFNVQWSTNLTHDSLMSIIEALVDKRGVSGTWTVTLGATNIAKLTADEQKIAENKGWNLG
jgi:hypothetical protein